MREGRRDSEGLASLYARSIGNATGKHPHQWLERPPPARSPTPGIPGPSSAGWARVRRFSGPIGGYYSTDQESRRWCRPG
ncbi:hypothetical protein GCM10017581_076590 [Dactylosporangium matsuzakiense]|uniref:Uncharacterized protein n=1 Tax=Dactylosporangium matsuzakiense TaxID=53360 RepID=A0A9W6KPQ4_9ACTN|nr:hypothetical protein GCM10017581_076590 [Dactylosporangium matsuzakiense]